MKITNIEGASPREITSRLRKAFDKLDYDASVRVEDSHVEVSRVRLSDDWIEKAGYNLSPYTGDRGRILNWDNWVQVNNAINDVLDNLDVSAHVYSLGGKFEIRDGETAFHEPDWKEHAYENVGSVISPVQRIDAWKPENPKKFRRLSSLDRLKEVV